MSQNHTLLDKLVLNFDNSLRAILGSTPPATRANPAKDIPEANFTDAEKKHIIGLLRIDHVGEICAQALYQGQALIARSDKIKAQLYQAADEENDHLHWCAERLKELHGRVSYLNPLWYLGSFCIGSTAAAFGDRISLGFLVETEQQVSKHLTQHLEQLPATDKKSRAILEKMYSDEQQHATTAAEAGAADLPLPIKLLMGLMSKVMTKTAYWI